MSLTHAGGVGARGSGDAVLFDFGGTLDADGLRWSVRFHEAYVAIGGGLDLDAFEPVFRASDRALESAPGIRSMGFREMIEAQATILGAMLPDGPATDPRAIARRVYADALTIAGRNRELLRGLRRTFRLGVVSNFTGNLSICLDELGLGELFAAVTDSAILGSSKPDARAFTHTLERLGVAPERAWLVGDNFEADVRPAHALGIRTVWLTTPDRVLPGGCTPTARIASLTELPGVLLPSVRPAPRVASRCTA